MRFETTEQETIAFVNMIRTGIATDANGRHERRTLDAINRGADVVESVVTSILSTDPEKLQKLADLAMKFMTSQAKSEAKPADEKDEETK